MTMLPQLRTKQLWLEDNILLFCEIVLAWWGKVLEALARAVTPITSRLLSRVPYPPAVSVQDIRANRIKLEFQPKRSSPFNIDEYEVEWRKAGTDKDENAWSSIGKMDLTFRTVARLKPGTQYAFRVRAINRKGTSSWTEPITATTRLDPLNGGADHGSFAWTQSKTEVSFTFKVPHGTAKRDLQLQMKDDQLDIQVRGSAGDQKAVLQGQLPHQVQPFTKGSYWEIVRDQFSTNMNVVLEKASPSVAPKFDYWRSCFVGFPEIDTHKVASNSDDQNNIIPAGSLTPAQMAQLGLRM